jgi:hypothetical protein
MNGFAILPALDEQDGCHSGSHALIGGPTIIFERSVPDLGHGWGARFGGDPWLGSGKVSEPFTYAFVRSDSGWLWAYAHGAYAGLGTFIAECSAETWKGEGFEWSNFRTVTNGRWYDGQIVFAGDAAPYHPLQHRMAGSHRLACTPREGEAEGVSDLQPTKADVTRLGSRTPYVST